MTWTDERLDKLRKLWLDGMSATDIAIDLAAGITRNAVIGKVHRLGLMRTVRGTVPAVGRRPGPQPRPPKIAAPKVPPRPKPVLVKPAFPPRPPREKVEAVAAGAPAPGSRMLQLFELSLVDHCKYIYGDPRDFENVRYCAGDVVEGTSWCAHHHAACCSGLAGRVKLPGEIRTDRQERQAAVMRAFYEKRRRDDVAKGRVTLGGRAA